MIFGLAAPGWSCTTVIVGKDATDDGSVIVSHSVDGAYDSRIVVVPGGTHEPGEMIDVYNGVCTDTVHGRGTTLVGQIPQVPVTYSYVHAGYPFMNEKGVLIGEDTWSGLRDMSNSNGMMMIENLQMYGLQRGATAREVVQIMGALAEEFGYGDGGETLTVVDANEGWVFDIIGPGPLWQYGDGTPGAVWVAQRVPDNHVYTSANRTRIQVVDLNDTANFMHSSNLVQTAIDFGLYNPDTDGAFHFAKTYNPTPYGSPYYQARREWRVFNLLLPHLNLPAFFDDPNLGQYDFSYEVPANAKINIRQVMALYRDSYQGTEFDLTVDAASGPWNSPLRHNVVGAQKPENVATSDWERAIGIARCSYTFVGQARSWMPVEIGSVAWIGEDAGLTTVFMPLYAGATETSPVLANVNRSGFERESAWWAFNFVGNWTELRYQPMLENRIRPLQQELENKFFEMQPAIEQAALTLYEQNPTRAREFVTDYSAKTAEDVTARWWKLADDLVYNYYDGMIELTTGGYPTWWLEQVGFGLSNFPENMQ